MLKNNNILKTIQNSLKSTIGQNKVIVGISGGVDSIFLLQMLIDSSLQGQIIIVHIDHLIREKSNMDREFVEKICKQHCLKYESKIYDIPKISKRRRIGIEECGRIYRYKYFEKIRKQYGAKYILTAHHANDLVETMIFNILRGSYVHGLIGIKKINSQMCYRPLLQLEKAEIIDSLKSRGIKWLEDESNTDCSFNRNYIRHKIVPKLILESKSFIKDMISLSKNAEAISEWLKINTKKLISLDNNIINVDKFANINEIIQRESILCLYEKHYLTRKNISFVWLEEIRKFIISSSSGRKKEFGSEYWMIKDFNRVTLIKRAEINEIANNFIPTLKIGDNLVLGNFTIELFDNEKNIDLNDSNCYFCYLDKAKIGNSLLVRRYISGDYIYKRGIKGSKSIKKWFIESKIPMNERCKYPIITTEKGDIVSIAAIYNNERYTHSGNTDNLIILRVNNR